MSFSVKQWHIPFPSDAKSNYTHTHQEFLKNIIHITILGPFHENNFSIIIKIWVYKLPPIHMGCPLWRFQENWLCYKGIALYSPIFTAHNQTQVHQGPILLTWMNFNSLDPGIFNHSLKLVNFKLVSTIYIFCENAIRLVGLDLFNDDTRPSGHISRPKIAIRWRPQHISAHQSTLVQIMTWCHQATSHYLSQCWPRPMLPYGVTRPQWVNPSMEKYSHAQSSVEWNWHSQNFKGATIGSLGMPWISNFIPHFIMGVITYPCWD